MPNWTGGRLPVILQTIVQTFFMKVRILIFRHKGLPGFAFGRFYGAPGFGPDDMEIFYISRSRACFYFSSSFSSTTDGGHAFIIKPDGITFFFIAVCF